MRKIILCAIVFLLASCGQNNLNEANKEENKAVNIPDYHSYNFITPKNDSNIFGYGLHIPDGFKMDNELYEKTGSILLKSADQKSSLSIVVVASYPHNDAQTFIERDVILAEKSTEFGKVATEEPWITPFPGEDDITSCEASFASVESKRNVNDVDFVGQTIVNWYDATQKKSGSVGFVFSMETPREDWEKLKPVFDLVRQSFVWLPSSENAQKQMQRTPDKKLKPEDLAYDSFDYSMLQLENGTPHGPGWETVFTNMAIGYDEKDGKYYLVKNEKTPSGLLPNPARQGMTLSRKLPKSLFSYIVEVTKLKRIEK